VTFWRTKAASLKRVKKIEAKLLWTAYRNSPTLFRTVPSPTPYGLPFLVIEGLQLSHHPLLSQEQVKLRTSNFVWTSQGRSEQKPMKNVGNSSRGRSQGVPKIFKAPALRGHLCDSTAFLYDSGICLNCTKQQMRCCELYNSMLFFVWQRA